MIKRIVFMGILSQFLLFAPLMAQEDRATITGTVSDTSGAVVPGVAVTATNVTTRVQTTSTSNDLGLYQIRNLPVGEYSLSFAKAGFQKLDRSGITLVIAQVAEIDVQLQVGAVTQTVEVTGAAPILESETNELGSTIGLNQIADLPLSISSGRDASVFAYDTIPGVEGNTWDSYVSGTQAFSKEILIDGTLAQASETGSLAENYPSMEAVQEFKVDTGGNGGSAGMYTSGGTFMYNLKSGTNQLHGSAVGFLHNEDLNANTWSNNYYGLPRGRDREVDYAFSAGGPIRIPHIYNGTNKTFFFAAFEQYRLHDTVEGPVNDTVPTAQFLQGNFSALLNTNVVLGTDAGGNNVYQGAIFHTAVQNNR
ncbi:MAG: carboxypeptidase-like regulatory domain-containing protein [Terriglobia bacterium]